MFDSAVNQVFLACTGHIDLSRIPELEGSRAELRRYLSASRKRVTALFCGFADGSDLLFAEEALGLGIPLVAILPCSAEEFAGEHASPDRFRLLLARAEEVLIARDRRARYAGVTQKMLDCCDELLALWDGRELPLFDGEGREINRGGTYDTIRRFLSAGKRTVVFRNGKSEVL